MHDSLAFWHSLIRNPRRVAAIAPSGAALAELMTSEISARNAPVIELGPGTGVFTQRLIERGIPQDRLILVEAGSDFSAQLAVRFPRARLLNMDAGRLRSRVLDHGEKAGAIVSGLPLLSMPAPLVLRILKGSFGLLRDGGAFYQFTYGPRAPVSGAMLSRLGLEARRIGRVFRNLPPASVYRITRRNPRAPDPDGPHDRDAAMGRTRRGTPLIAARQRPPQP